MSIWWEGLPLVTFAGTTLFCAWKWVDQRFAYRWALEGWRNCADKLEITRRELEEFHKDAAEATHVMNVVLDELDQIKVQRHRSARHARKCQINQYLSRQREKTAQLRAEVGR